MNNGDVRRRCGSCKFEFTTHGQPFQSVWTCPNCAMLLGTMEAVGAVEQENAISRIDVRKQEKRKEEATA